MGRQADELTLEIVRVIDAPRAVVWRCWTQPELLKQWYCPKPWAVTKADMDVRAGGRFNTVMEGPTDERVDNEGCFLEVVPGERLTFTDGYTEGFMPRPSSFMTGYVLLTDEADGKTRMAWGARHATQETRDQHLEMGFEQGWGAAAAQLEELATRVAAAS